MQIDSNIKKNFLNQPCYCTNVATYLKLLTYKFDANIALLKTTFWFLFSRTLFPSTDQAFMQSVSSNSCATRCLRRSHVRISFVFICREDAGICTDSLTLCPIPVKPSPSKKSRGGGQGGLRRAPTLGAPTPLSHATTQPAVESRVVYHSHFKSTDAEADSSKKRCLPCNLIC